MSPKKPGLIDTNLLVRYFVEDDLQKADAVEKLLKDPHKNLILLDVTFAETVWVLSSYYSLEKEQIINNLSALLDIPSIVANRKVLHKALEYLANHNISFIDAYQAGFAQAGDLEIYSYDKDFDKLADIRRIEPG